MNISLADCCDKLFEQYLAYTENSRKKASVWPFKMMMLIFCPVSKMLLGYSSANDKFLYFAQLKGFADNRRNMTVNSKFVSGRVENVVGKGENASYQHFLLFSQCFQKASFSRSF